MKRMSFDIFRGEIYWNTTAYNGAIAKEINKILTSKLREICKIILNIVPNVISIYVTNSYSCGEASVIFDSGKILFMSDLDLVVISKKVPQLYLLQLQAKVTRKITLNNPSVDVKLVNERLLREQPYLLFRFGLETAKCIYGEDILSASTILNNLWIDQLYTYMLKDELFYYFDRLFKVLIPFSTKLIPTGCIELNDLQKIRLMHSTAKLLIACHKVLLLSSKIFVFGSTKKERLEYIKLNWNKFRPISQELPTFVHLSEELLEDLLRPRIKYDVEYVLNKWVKTIWTASRMLKSLFKLDSRKAIHNFIKSIYTPGFKLINLTLKVYEGKPLSNVTPSKALAALLMLGFSVEGETINEYWLNEALKEVRLYKCLGQSNIMIKLRNLSNVIAKSYISAFSYLPTKSYIIR